MMKSVLYAILFFVVIVAIASMFVINTEYRNVDGERIADES
ncbi:MAG: hypothetical protein OYG31_00025 [Candidatus Kaiserbacteria bacterium]|nr:hypothetical protein [Candidatus Kaiserbacteria bacterium]